MGRSEEVRKEGGKGRETGGEKCFGKVSWFGNWLV